jgi:hypothetical protein
MEDLDHATAKACPSGRRILSQVLKMDYDLAKIQMYPSQIGEMR